MGTEVEVKLLAPPRFELPQLTGFTARPPRHLTLRAWYWDTEALELLAWGVTVRHRTSSDGTERGWTVKVVTGSQAASTRRTEVEIAGDESAPPPLVEALIRPLLAGTPVKRIARVTTERCSVELHDDDGNEVEVTIDDVESSTGDTYSTRHEVEVELLAGDERAVHDVVRQLLAAGLRPTDAPSKFVAAITASRPIPASPLGASSGRPPATAVDLVRAAVAGATERLVQRAVGVQTGDDPEDVHQARVATRRLRSDLKTLSPLLDEAAVRAVRDELRWLGRLLGTVRDLDVLVQRLPDDLVSAGCHAPAGQRLLETARSERRERVAELRAALSSDRYVALIGRLVAVANCPPLGAEVDGCVAARKVADRLAERQWKRVHGLRRAVRADATDEALHDLRRAAKRARYAYELVQPVTPRKRYRRRAKRLADVQSLLGDLQDAVTAEQWLLHTVAPSTGGDVAFAAGLLVAHQRDVQRAVRARWRSEWKRLT